MYEDLESAIVAILQPFESVGFAVVSLPEKQSEQSKPFENGKITIAYGGSDYDQTQSIGAGNSQYEDVTVAIMLQSRNLKGDKGIYNLIGLVRRYLLGRKPMAGFQRLIAKKVELKEVSHVDGLWTYYMSFVTRTIAVEEYSESVLAEALLTLQFDNTLTGATFPETE